MPNLTYTVADFLPFTKIISADVNSRFSDIKTLLNTTGLTSTNIQQYGLTRDRIVQTSANQVLINDGTGAMSSEAQLALSRGGTAVDLSSLAGNAGSAIIVNTGETALQYGSPLQQTLTESLSGVVSSLTAGEAITANDAVCLDIGKDVTNSNIYRVFRCNSTLANRRRNYLGIAQAGATVVAHIETWVASANFVTSNSIAYSVNGRSYTTAFTTDNATTLQAVATKLATDPDISGASSDGVHTITVTGKGGLFVNITGSVVTGGASQPTIVVATTQSPSGQNVRIQCFGPFASLSGLTTGSIYYLSSSTGAITAAPADTNPIQVGQALSSTVLFINPNVANFQFGAPLTMIRSHGASTNSAANAQQDSEHFNFTSWAAGTASTNGARWNCGGGQGTYGSLHLQLDGRNTSDTATLLFQSYNKASWAVLTNRVTVSDNGTVQQFNGFFYAGKGTAAGTTNVKWNGATWSVLTAWTNSLDLPGSFTTNSLLDNVGGETGGSFSTSHETLNSSDVKSTATVIPAAGSSAFSGNIITSGLTQAAPSTSTSTVAYAWNGTTWSSALTATTAIEGARGATAASGSNTVSQLIYINGGASGSPTNGTFKYNGSTFSSDTASTNTRTGGPIGSVI